MLIGPLKDLPDWRVLLPQAEEIFFTSSAVKSFTDDAHRARFRERWFGRYLDRHPKSFLVALDEGGNLSDPKKWDKAFGSDEEYVIGYLAGCLDDPRNNPLFADLAYYEAFGSLCDTYPAHLHINVAEAARGKGVGSALIEAFAAQVKRAGLPGLHLVTDQGNRNVRFYERNGFKILATALSHNVPVVFMGRRTV